MWFGIPLLYGAPSYSCLLSRKESVCLQGVFVCLFLWLFLVCFTPGLSHVHRVGTAKQTWQGTKTPPAESARWALQPRRRGSAAWFVSHQFLCLHPKCVSSVGDTVTRRHESGRHT